MCCAAASAFRQTSTQQIARCCCVAHRRRSAGRCANCCSCSGSTSRSCARQGGTSETRCTATEDSAWVRRATRGHRTTTLPQPRRRADARKRTCPSQWARFPANPRPGRRRPRLLLESSSVRRAGLSRRGRPDRATLAPRSDRRLRPDGTSPGCSRRRARKAKTKPHEGRALPPSRGQTSQTGTRRRKGSRRCSGSMSSKMRTTRQTTAPSARRRSEGTP